MPLTNPRAANQTATRASCLNVLATLSRHGDDFYGCPIPARLLRTYVLQDSATVPSFVPSYHPKENDSPPGVNLPASSNDPPS
jgi:hypothetical protein